MKARSQRTTQNISSLCTATQLALGTRRDGMRMQLNSEYSWALLLHLAVLVARIRTTRTLPITLNVTRGATYHFVPPEPVAIVGAVRVGANATQGTVCDVVLIHPKSEVERVLARKSRNQRRSTSHRRQHLKPEAVKKQGEWRQGHSGRR